MLPAPIPNSGDSLPAGRPFGHRRPSPPPSKTMEDVWQDINLQAMGVQDFLGRRPTSSSAPPATVLSLNPGPEFHFPGNDHAAGDDDSPGAGDALPSSVLASFGKQRLPGGGDRRYKRMMMNRASAARSRARKQAYMNGLLLKIEHLKKENDQLREQHKKLMLLQAEPVLQFTKKHLLQRASTAPF